MRAGNESNRGHSQESEFILIAGPSPSVMPSSYPLFEAKGTHRELGRLHGEQCKDRLFTFVDYLGHILKLSRAQLHARALRFLPLFETQCPSNTSATTHAKSTRLNAATLLSAPLCMRSKSTLV